MISLYYIILYASLKFDLQCRWHIFYSVLRFGNIICKIEKWIGLIDWILSILLIILKGMDLRERNSFNGKHPPHSNCKKILYSILYAKILHPILAALIVQNFNPTRRIHIIHDLLFVSEFYIATAIILNLITQEKNIKKMFLESFKIYIKLNVSPEIEKGNLFVYRFYCRT